MAPRMIEMITTMAICLLSIFLFRTGMVGAQSNCASAIMSLSPCLSISVAGNSSSPSSSCCSQLVSLVETTPMCLCDVMNGSGAEVLGLVLNRTLAQALPGACNVQTPPLTNCYNGFGSQTPISSDGDYSEGAILMMSYMLPIFLVFIASYIPKF